MGVKSLSGLALSLLLVTACSGKPYAIKPYLNKSGQVNRLDRQGKITDTKVYIVSHGWHTGFVLPAEDIQILIPEIKQRFADKKFIEFGWGDKGFYQAEEITSGLTLQAIFWPTESVIHAVSVPENVRGYFAHSKIEEICLSNREYSNLVEFIVTSFYRDEYNKVVEMNQGIYGDSQFYKGEGDYYLMNTCNKWTAKGLKSAGLDISPMFKLTAASVMDYLYDKRIKLKDIRGFQIGCHDLVYE